MSQLYGSLKFVNYPDRLKALRNGTIAAPVHVRIKPMNRCNHNCWYCAYRADQLQLGEDIDYDDTIPEDKMDEIADDLISMGVKAVTFSGGGEPTLYKPLPRIVRKLAEGGIRVATLTNGSNLQGAMADAFADCGTWVRISLDSWDDASYAKARGVKEGAFTKMLRNMKAFSERGSDCVLGTSFIIGKDNHTHILEVARLLRDAGVDHVKMSAAVVSNDVVENNQYHREIFDVVTRQIDASKELETDTFKIVNHYHETEERFQKSYTVCPFLQFLTVIGADCKVYTCQDKAYTDPGTLGSIRDQSFKTFWFSEENRKKIAAFDPSKLCSHHCVAHNKNLALMEILSQDPDHASFV